MTSQNIEQFMANLKQDLNIEELLIAEYSETLAKEELYNSLTTLEKEEIIKTINILKNDSVWHKEAITRLIKEAEENPWSTK